MNQRRLKATCHWWDMVSVRLTCAPSACLHILCATTGNAALAEGDEQLAEQLEKTEEENLQLIEENSGLLNKARPIWAVTRNTWVAAVYGKHGILSYHPRPAAQTLWCTVGVTISCQSTRCTSSSTNVFPAGSV